MSLGAVRRRVLRLILRADDQAAGVGVDDDVAGVVDGDRHRVQRPRRRPGLSVAIVGVDRTVARAVEPLLTLDPRHRAAEMNALPVERLDTVVRDIDEKEPPLRIAVRLRLRLRHRRRRDGDVTAKGAGLVRPEQEDEATGDLGEHDQAARQGGIAREGTPRVELARARGGVTTALLEPAEETKPAGSDPATGQSCDSANERGHGTVDPYLAGSQGRALMHDCFPPERRTSNGAPAAGSMARLAPAPHHGTTCRK